MDYLVIWSQLQPAGNVIHSVLKNVHQNRKRQHQSAARDEALRSEITGGAEGTSRGGDKL